jgi:hypothetical protein
MSKIPDDSWLETVAEELVSTTGLPQAEARRLVHEGEQRALADGQVIEVDASGGRCGRHRWRWPSPRVTS